jgi:predicted O-methyltransferase YrrM
LSNQRLEPPLKTPAAAVKTAAARLSVQEILALEPRLHVDYLGESRTMSLDQRVLELIDRHVEDGSRTLETGCGVSTLVLIGKGCHHTSVSPDDHAFTQIRAFCEEHGLSTDRTRLVTGFSENVLPGLDMGTLDAVVIDGSHGFPAPFIDWFYAERALRVGGFLVVDDIAIWPPHVLKTFLDMSPEWDVVEVIPERSAMYVKRANVADPQDWWEQPAVLRETSRLHWGVVRDIVDGMHLLGPATKVLDGVRRLRKPRGDGSNAGS